MMIKVLHIAHEFLPDGLGTARRIFNSQPKDGVSHYLVIPTYSDPTRYQIDPCFEVQQARVVDAPIGKFAGHMDARRMARVALRLVRDEGIDLLYAHSPVACARAMLHVHEHTRDLPMVYEPHVFMYAAYIRRLARYPQAWFKKLIAPYFQHMIETERKLIQRCDTVICQTEALKNKLKELYPQEMTNAVIATNGLPTGVSADSNSVSEQVRSRLPVTPFLFFGGYLSKGNGVQRICELAPLAPDIPIVVAGDGPCAAMVAAADKSNASLTYLGKLEKEDYYGVLAASKAIVSLRQQTMENDVFLPLKVLDAIALHRPIITSDLAIMREAARVYPQIEVVGDDPEAVTNCIRKLLGSSVPLSKQSEHPAGKASQEYNWDTTQRVLQRHFKKLLDSKK